MPLPAKIADRLTTSLKRFQSVLASARDRDVGEADTSTIIKDMLAEMFGYDKYSEITAEYAIKGTFCDLALKLDGKLRILVEVKAIGLDLKEAHTKQAVDYAANQGVEWVILTNGMIWKVYRVIFAQPIAQEQVMEINICAMNPRSEAHLETLHMLTREGQGKALLDDYHVQRQAMSRFYLGAMILSDAVIDTIRRELKKISPGVRFDSEEIREAMTHEVIKREVLEGDKAVEARKKIARAQTKASPPKPKTEIPTEAPQEKEGEP